MKKRIVLCADDFGQASHISQAILQLLEKGRISATSCMVNGKRWHEEAQRLVCFKDQADIGLHFNLTEGRALSALFARTYGDTLFSLPTLLCRSLMRQLNQSVLEAECHAQIDHFEKTLGFLPHFIDGHQHIHQFPVIRDALIRVYEARLNLQAAYIRLVDTRVNRSDLNSGLKKTIIQVMGTRGLQRLLKIHHIPHNHSFSGIYSFSKSMNYSAFFPEFLKEITDGGLIMCHPGQPSSDPLDPIVTARSHEYAYLAGPQFEADCAQEGVFIDRFLHRLADDSLSAII